MSYNMNPPGTSAIINNVGGQFDNTGGYFEDAILQDHHQDGQMHTEDWLSKPDRPWNIVQPAPTSGPPAVSAPEYLTSGSNPNAFFTYRNTYSLSECDTVPGDSGYGGSIIQPSIEDNSVFGEEPYNTTDQNVDPELEFHLNIQDANHSYNVPKFEPGPSRGSSDHGKLFCEGCSTFVRTQSELNKHKQRHDRPYTCSEKDCKRYTHGFASQNDLVRHQRSVHKQHQLIGKTFVCRHEPCRTKEQKKWPRADNFRSHLQRVHKMAIHADADLSEYLYKEPISTGFHEDLSGVGTGPTLQRTVMPSGGQDIIPEQHFGNASIGGFAGIHSPLSATLPATNDFPSSSNMSFYTEKQSMPTLPSHTDYQPNQPSSPYRPEKQSPKLKDPQARSPIVRNARRGSRSLQNRLQPSRSIKGEPSSSAPSVKITSSQTKALKKDVAASPAITKGRDSKALGKALYQESPSSHGSGNATFNPFGPDFQELLKRAPKHMLEEALACTTDSEDAHMGGTSDTNRECPTCHKTFARPCELRKHVRRHERPYACTVYKCDKRFGSKNDWKRHETGQHSQPEVWFCGPNCSSVFNRRETLEQHLRNSHGMLREEEIHERLESNRRGSHCMGMFWCGFCGEFISVDAKESVSDQRFNHIDGHFMGREDMPKGRIEEWRYMEERIEEPNQATDLGRKRKLSRQTNNNPRPTKQLYHRP